MFHLFFEFLIQYFYFIESRIYVFGGNIIKIIITIIMIKGEVLLKEERSKVCFNPSCPSPENRVFTKEHPHAYNIVCLNWILDVKNYDF